MPSSVHFAYPLNVCSELRGLTTWYLDDVLLQDNGASVGFAVAGGILLCLGNIGTQYALAYTNLSITEVVSSSLTVVGGTIL